jgi:hypothetical protein
MDTDLMLVLGISLGVLSIPSMISAFTDGRSPRFAAVTILIAGALLVFALGSRPSGYALNEVFGAFERVWARYLW